jgi:hypothetical protein
LSGHPARRRGAFNADAELLWCVARRSDNDRSMRNAPWPTSSSLKAGTPLCYLTILPGSPKTSARSQSPRRDTVTMTPFDQQKILMNDKPYIRCKK